MLDDANYALRYSFKDIAKDIYIDIQAVYYENIPIKTATPEPHKFIRGSMSVNM